MLVDNVGKVMGVRSPYVLCRYQKLRRTLKNLEHCTDVHKRRKENKQPVIDGTKQQNKGGKNRKFRIVLTCRKSS